MRRTTLHAATMRGQHPCGCSHQKPVSLDATGLPVEQVVGWHMYEHSEARNAQDLVAGVLGADSAAQRGCPGMRRAPKCVWHLRATPAAAAAPTPAPAPLSPFDLVLGTWPRQCQRGATQAEGRRCGGSQCRGAPVPADGAASQGSPVTSLLASDACAW